MTLEDIAQSLPNGLHDAKLHGFSVDYAAQSAHVDLHVWIGTADNMEAYRSAALTLEGLEYWIIEPPDPGQERELGSLTIRLRKR